MLTDRQVEAVKSLLDLGLSDREVATGAGVSKNTVAEIRTGRHCSFRKAEKRHRQQAINPFRDPSAKPPWRPYDPLETWSLVQRHDGILWQELRERLNGITPEYG